MSIFSKEKREERKALRASWKEYKKNKKIEDKVAKKLLRESLKEEYAGAPLLTRFYHVHAVKIRRFCISIAVIVIIGYLCSDYLASSYERTIKKFVFGHLDKVNASETDLEVVHALSPIDEEGAARIAAIPGNKAEDTWTFCVYIVGADLEDNGENDLSDYVKVITMQEAQENSENSTNMLMQRLEKFSSEISEKGLDVPEYLYEIQKPIASSVAVTNDVIVAERKGCASDDISEMCKNVLPDNITLVVQTGGAKRWSNALVNPNKTQRFVIKNGIMSEVMNMHIQDSCNPDTLVDFISYCDENYKSDHMAMILWDHGGGIAGYGVDRIFNTGMTLEDLNSAFAKALTKDIENPYFDFIGFDACLMAATDTAVALDGYGKYLLASEEVEPGNGWDYTKWLKALADNPTMSAAAVGQEIADSYTDFYMKQNGDRLWRSLAGNTVVTFSVSDLHKAAQVDAAYEAMNEQFLKKVVDDPSVLVDMSRAAKSTMRYAGSAYNVYNTIDLGTYVDYLSEIYPDECAEVRKLLKEAVLYKRSNLYLEGSQGLSIYFPIVMDSPGSLSMFTDYVYNISDKESTNALYYYKVAGCLNDDMQEYVTNVAGKEVKTLNTKIFYDYQSIVPSITDNNEIIINVGDELCDSIQDVYLETARYDEDNNLLTYYGTDDCCRYDGNGNIVADVDATWFAIDGSMLEADFSFGTDTTSTYVATVLHNFVPSYMTFTVDHETEEVVINSVVKIPDDTKLEYDAALRGNTELLPGDIIVPILTQQSADGQGSSDIHGDAIKYKTTTKIELIDLQDGDYVQSVVITDLRGDKYYSPVVEGYFNNGEVEELKINPQFVGKN